MAANLGWHSRGYLPHFDSDSVQQVITWHLADSLPTAIAESLAAMSDEAGKRRRYEAYLDAGHGACVLRDPDCARIVEDAFLHFDTQRYRLLAWVVMPNHVHVMIGLLPGFRLHDLVRSWKRHTALAINRRLGHSDPLWRREYWDRFIRDEDHFQAALRYIEENPVKARLAPTAAAWPWSSAGRRA